VSIDPALKWGFVVFRCTYGEDEAWKEFMDHLNTHVRLKFIKDGCEGPVGQTRLVRARGSRIERYMYG
jgi:hypothetical protein